MQINVPMIGARSWRAQLVSINVKNGSCYFPNGTTPDMVLGGLLFVHSVYDLTFHGDCLVYTDGMSIKLLPLTNFKWYDPNKHSTVCSVEEYREYNAYDTIMNLREYARKNIIEDIDLFIQSGNLDADLYI